MSWSQIRVRPVRSLTGTPDATTSPPAKLDQFEATSSSESLIPRVQAFLRDLKGPIVGAIMGATAIEAAAGAPLDAATLEPLPDGYEESLGSAASATCKLEAGPVLADDLFQADLCRRIERLASQLDNYAAVDPQGVVRVDLIEQSGAVANLHRFVQEEASLPRGLLIDLHQALEVIETTQLNLSEQTELPAQVVANLKDLMAASATNFPDAAQEVIARYTAIGNTISGATAVLPDFQLPLANPLLYNTGDGLIFVPTGAQVQKQGSQFAIESPGLLWVQDDLTVVSTNASLSFSDTFDGLQAQTLHASNNNGSADFFGAQLGLNRVDQSGYVIADRVELNSGTQQALLTNASLFVGPSGDAALRAERLQFAEGNRNLDIATLDLTQTREGTDLVADRLTFQHLGTLVQADALALSFGPQGNRLVSDRLLVTTPDNQLLGSNVTLQSVVNASGSQLVLQASDLELAGDFGHITSTGATTLDLSWGPDGSAERLVASAEALSFSGETQGEHPLLVSLGPSTFGLAALPDGGHDLTFAGAEGAFEVEGHHIALDGAQQVVLRTTEDGLIDSFSADFPGQVEFRDKEGDLAIVTRDTDASYTRDGSRIELDFVEADLSLRGPGLQAQIVGAETELEPGRFSLQVDEAKILQALSAELNVTVESMSLEILSPVDGGRQSVDLSLAALAGNIEGVNTIVRTESGDRVRLHVATDEDGQVIQQAFLQIPEGGELRIQKDDLALRLGGQHIEFSQDDTGTYRLGSQDTDLLATLGDATVRVTGGDASVFVDPNSGHIGIDRITGTRVDFTTPQNNEVHLDIAEAENFIVRMTGLEGSVTGAAFQLDPTQSDARINASLFGNAGGIPFTFDIQDAHQLSALGQLSENQVQIYAKDPTGQGNLRFGVGPLTLEGSAIEVVGRYHQFDAGRMLHSVQQITASAGTDLFPGVRFEKDGVLRFGTDREGVNAELAVLLPSQFASPSYRLNFGNQSDAPGLIASLGYRHGGDTYALFGGVVPGAHATLSVEEGKVSAGGVPLPSKLDLPATGVVGLRAQLARGDGDLGLMAGALINPTSFIDSPYLTEEQPYGVMLGLEYVQDNLSLSAGAVVGLDSSIQPKDAAFSIRLGISF